MTAPLAPDDVKKREGGAPISSSTIEPVRVDPQPFGSGNLQEQVPTDAGDTSNIFDSYAQEYSKRAQAASNQLAGQLDQAANMQYPVGTGTRGPMATGKGLAGDFVRAAEGVLGVPYVYGGTTAQGVDCSGLIYYAAQAAGFNIPRYVAEDFATKVGYTVSLSEARPGDIVYWQQPGDDHVGIYIGNNQYIQAPQPGDVVKISTLTRPPTRIARFLPENAWG